MNPHAAVATQPEPLETAAPAPSWLTEEGKESFLAELRAAVSATADEGMAGTGRTSSGCPYIEHWFSHYGSKDAAHVQRAIRRFDASAGAAASGKEAIPLLAARVRRSVDQWALTGEISGLPEDTPAQLPGAAQVGRVFFQARAGGARAIDSPAQVRHSLGPGEPLTGTTRGRMERALGRSFEQVRLHTDSNAQGLAGRMNARAFTVGDHVAFGAGEFRPGSTVGDALLAHELAHVAQQGESGYNTATETEIEEDAGQAVEMVLRKGGPLRPQLTTGLALARCSKTAAPAKVPKAGGAKAGEAKPSEAKEDPKVTALKAELVATFGFSAVTDSTDAKWTEPELQKMKRALARIPAAERGAIRGVELRRVVTASEFGSTASGLFHQEIAPGTGIRQDRIEIANDAFDSDKDYDAGGAQTIFGGQVVEGAPSEGVLSHEVGHAVESVKRRQAEETRVKADVASTAAFDTFQKARVAYNAAIFTRLDVPAWSNAKEKAYMDAILGAQKKLAAITDAVDKLPETPTAAETKAGAARLKKALDPAKKAITARNKARAALPKGSTYAMAAAEAAQDAWMAAAVALLPPFEARAKAQADAEKAHDAEDDTQITIRVSSGRRVRMTRRLADFVALIEANKIDIPNAGLGNHVTTHWPDNPEEAYAELYSLSVTAPEGLKKFDKGGAVAKYFSSPVGLKGSQKAQAATWIAGHR